MMSSNTVTDWVGSLRLVGAEVNHKVICNMTIDFGFFSFILSNHSL